MLTAVLSVHYDLAGTGVDSTETLLTPTTVNTASFGKQFATQIDGQSYGQPLYVPGVNINSGSQQGTHNVIYVVTENDSLYAIDAHGGNILWQDSFLSTSNAGVNLLGASSITTVPSADVGSSDISPQIGVTATPAISLADNAIYVEAKTKQIIGSNTAAPNYVHTLYKVDIGSGAIDTSVIIGDTIYSNGNYTFRVTNTTGTGTDPYVNGTGDGAITSQGSITWGGTSRVYFNALRAMDRPGLTIDGSSLYVSFASHGDNGPYHGWLLRFDLSTLTLTAVLNTEPNGGLGGIWQGGGPITIDSSGNIYFETGNGTFNTAASNFGPNYSGLPKDADYGDSFVKVVNDPTTSVTNQNANGWGLEITDFFSPSNNASLNSADTDLGSAGPIALPDGVGSAAHPDLLIGAGKEGKIYLIDRNDMGGFSPTADNVVQETGANAVGGALSSPAFFYNNPTGSTPSGILYYQSDYGGYLQAYTISNGSFTALADSPDYYSSSLDGSPTVSANGTATPIIWALYRAGNQLRAYNALNLNDEIWTSNSNADGADVPSGNITKFSTPTVADGLVMVADDSYLNVYGPPVPPTSAPAAPAGVTVSSTVYSTVNVSWQDLSNNEDSFYIERSTDQTNWSVVGIVSANVTTYADTTALATTTYYYRVRSHNSYQGGSYSAYAYSPAITTPQAPPSGTGDGLLANYYLNVSNGAPLSGPVVLTRDDSSIDFNWGTAPPAPGVSETYFSVVWTGNVVPTVTGSYTFTTDSDDGCRLYLNGTQVISDFVNQAATTTNYTTTLTAGQSYAIVMDYFQGIGDAQADLFWTPPGGTQVPVPFAGGYAVGAYHNDVYLRGTPVLSRVESTVDSNLDWSNGSPSSSVPDTYFSASWTGMVQAQYTETYTFYTTSDDGIALWVNGRDLINDWTDQSATTQSATIVLSAGQEVPIEVDYFQDGGSDEAQLQWSSAHTQEEDIPQSQLYSGTAPAAPSGLSATPTSGTQLTLNWTSNSTIQTGFLIQRKVDGTTAWSTIGSVAANVTTYPDINLSPGTTYDYQVQATNFEASSAFSNTWIVTLPTIPQTPDDAYPSNITTTSLVANWTDRSSNATGYRVGIALGDADFDYILVNTPNLSTYPFGGLVPGTEYDVHISAYNIAGYNDFAGFTTATLTLPPTAVTTTPGSNQVTLNWTAPALNAPDFDGLLYNVYRGTSPGNEAATPIATGLSATTFTDTTATNGATWYYTVTAVDPGGESAPSTEVSAVPQAPQAVSLSGPALYLKEDADAQHVDVWNNAAGAGNYVQQLLVSELGALTLTANANSTGAFTLDLSSGNFLPAAGVTFNGDGSNPLQVIGTSGTDTLTVGTNLLNFDSMSIHYTGAQQVQFDPDGGDDALSLSSGARLILAAPAAGVVVRQFSSLSVATGAELDVASATSASARALLVVSNFSIAVSNNVPTAKLDLGSNDLDIVGGSLTTIDQYLFAGMNTAAAAAKTGSLWGGEGICSSAAGSNTLMALGAILNNVGGSAIYGASATKGLFDTYSPGFNDILIKYTVYGDANLDGEVNIADYALTDAAFSRSLVGGGWYNGDFNYDGHVNGDDYSLLDNSFNVQSGASSPSMATAALIAAPAGSIRATAVSPAAVSINPIDRPTFAQPTHSTAAVASPTVAVRPPSTASPFVTMFADGAAVSDTADAADASLADALLMAIR